MLYFCGSDGEACPCTLAALLREGGVGIMPTDTVYGLTAHALDRRAVARVLRLKGRSSPMTLIPHSLDWARELVASHRRGELSARSAELAGPYTALFPHDPSRVRLPPPYPSAPLIAFRRPRHWLTALAERFQLPLVSTSVNLTGRAPMTGLDNLPPSIKAGVDFVVYEGPLPGPPSTLVYLDAEEPRVVSRGRDA